ncbi:glutamate-5-semialdehyde dehydrogenase [Glaciecola sp. MF2-115]|uniref:glutamate-5-semialdehyde dehydrogenase n=1 Tax=Glaciecola sp. MF2-115 TaxID=3384827 RepID=UPI0039A34142
MSLIQNLSRKAAEAAQILSVVDEADKNAVLMDMAKTLRENAAGIIKENVKDLDNAKENDLAASMVDRLTLNEERIEAMAEGLETVAILPDPVGVLRDLGTRPNGLQIRKMRVPLGVVCMIYEARPNVTADAAGLCFKSGNAAILRGGKEALASSLFIANLLQDVLEKHNLPRELISVVPNADRALMQELMEQKDYIDVIIPRGGEGLINYVTENSKVPVIQHFKGVCHLYIDSEADIETGINLLVNGKTQRTGVCNALEGLLVHEDVADEFLSIAGPLLEEYSVKVHACENSAKYFNKADIIPVEDFGQEYLDLEIAVRIVPSIEGAMEHIARFGSNHTEVICTKNDETAQRFQRTVDSSVVMVNASSRFSDGSQLGLGAEIGIATTKLHAYGPMGLESLTTEKYLVNGVGQVRA